MTDAQNQIIGLLKEIKAAAGGGGAAAWGDISGTLSNQTDLQTALDALAPPYLVYTALLTQTTTEAPVATVLQNTLGGAVTPSYIGTGTYILESSGLFTEDKTAIFISNPNFNDLDVTCQVRLVDATTIRLTTFRNTIGLYDEILAKSAIEIRVYT